MLSLELWNHGGKWEIYIYIHFNSFLYKDWNTDVAHQPCIIRFNKLYLILLGWFFSFCLILYVIYCMSFTYIVVISYGLKNSRPNLKMGIPSGSKIKKLPAIQETAFSAGDYLWCWRCMSYLWVGKICWRKKWQPTPFLLGNPMDRGVWWAIDHGVPRVRHGLATKLPPSLKHFYMVGVFLF